MLVIGLTGGIASGKSTVSKEFAENGIPIIDADVIARQVVEPGRKAYEQVVAAFGEDVPGLVNPADSSLNRPALGKAVFGKPEKLKVLNKIVHGAVKKEMAWQLVKAYTGGHKMVILDVPLLFESGIHSVCGATVTVFTEKEVQLKRLLERNPELTEEDARNRIESQLSNDVRNYRADIVLDNNGSVGQLKENVKSVVSELSPNVFWHYVDLIPPIGFASAFFTVAVRACRDLYKGSSPPKKQD
ncbi:hypothetical protein FT663_04344 [Candidozyma haemuli var. vulneris]|uniref:Dephospho-CoA kinase n=1 Tax=Candidozyma haemuli TaxID=45357 RepID=A0A2V1AWI3_9ASCO|nr:dephospho-CoA kinase [[Candida] haemuloni]KAF3986623.1 hypothetical protein FT662_04448 [[Candida] haemuloni var. vulneris]KAF3987723.1 hypothetical protein FT663_04344 [[Candida] haemuloni var. vulneris]PVH22218.1 dephospho-CoA kinase [[Candida] haemuloni]